MPRYRVPVTCFCEAVDAESAFLLIHTAVIGAAGVEALVSQAEFVPEPMDPDSKDFQDGYRVQKTLLDALEPDERVEVAFSELQRLQAAGQNYAYGRMKSCQEVVDQARKRASGGFGFEPVDPKEVKAGQDLRSKIAQEGW